MVFMNETGIVYAVMQGMTSNVTGSENITYLFIFFAILMICILLRIPIEFASLLVFPLVTVLVAYGKLYAIAIIILALFIGVLIVKHWLFSER